MTRKHRKTRVALIPATLLLLTLTYCNRETTTSLGGSKTTPDAAAVGTLAARAIALAMAEPAVRSQILGDMRDSPFSEHKLVLQEYLVSTGGKRVLDAMQRAGVDVENLRSAVEGIGRIQFYAVNTDQRASWRGTADIMVVPQFNQELPTIGYGPSATTVRIDLSTGRMPSGVGALFVLQWAEPMFHRWSGPTLAIETIQMPEESQLASGTFVRDASGRVTSTIDDTPLGSTRVAASATFEEPAGTYLTQLDNVRGVGDGLSGDHLEFEFHATASDNPITYVSALTGVSTDAGSAWVGWKQVHTSRMSTGKTMEIKVWETDGSPNDNDPFYCIASDSNCRPAQSQWPFLDNPFGFSTTWILPVCENSPNNCSTADLRLTFRDRATPVATQVTVSPQNATINKGATQAYTAQVFDQYGGLMPSKVVAWSSLNTGIATVASTGTQSATATGVGGGTVEIRGTVDGVFRGGTLIVLAPATVTISPTSLSVCSGGGVGGTGWLTATVKDQQGTVWTMGNVGWSSTNANIASVTAYDARVGRVVGGTNGQVTATASIDGVSGTAAVTTGTCLPAPTSCTLDYIPTPHYLRFTWVNANSTASTEVEYMPSNSNWQPVTTVSPGGTSAVKNVGPGLYYGRVRHVKAGFLPSAYCVTNAKTVP